MTKYIREGTLPLAELEIAGTILANEGVPRT